ncbi:MAG: hypothetical protein GQ574_00395 [Crocinitomix sp.]|nr:hypothetical protein [Crocinitomix sp.]
MNTKHHLLGLACVLFSIQGITQTFKDATVLGTIPLGSSEYAIIQEDGTENYYETSPYPTGELTDNQALELKFTNGQTDQAEVIATSLTSVLFAQYIQPTDPPGATIPPTYTLPTVENGILFFTSTQHIAEVYDALTIFTEDGDIDEQLDIIEATYTGFTSYRTWFINEYNWLNGSFTLQELDELYAENFIPDEIKKTLLNQDRFIGIGDSIYYFHDLGYIMRVHKDNQIVLGHFEDIEREDEPLDSASNLPQHITEIDIIDGPTVHQDRGFIYVTPPEGEETDSCWYRTRIHTSTSEACNPFLKTLQITLIEYFKPAGGDIDSIGYWVGGMTAAVNWDDGTPLDIIDGYGFDYFSHDYDPYGIYKVQTSISFLDRYGNPQTILDGDAVPGGLDITLVVDFTCTRDDSHSGTSVGDGSYQIIGITWVNFNILGHHIGSATHLYKHVGGGSFELVKGKIFTKVWGMLHDNVCIPQNYKEGDKTRNNQKKTQKVKSKFWKYYRIHEEDGIRSFHYFVKSGSAGDVLGHATPCP